MSEESTEQRPEPTEGGAESPRARLIFAGALAAVLVAVVAAVLIVGSSGEGSPEVEPAPAACVESWNADRQALAFGRHNSSAHNYTDVQVTYLTKEAEPADAQTGMCAVVFGRSTLDPEPGASGQVLLPSDRWLPISVRLGVDERQLTKLQVDALQQANAELEEDGTIVAVD